MEHFDVLDELTRPKRKCEGFNNELNDFKRLMKDGDELDLSYQKFLRRILDNDEMDRDDNRKRKETPNSDEEEQPVRRNKILEIQVKVEGQKADISNHVSKKRCERAHPYCDEANLPGVKEPSKGFPRSVCLHLHVSSVVPFNLSNLGINCYLCCMINRRLVRVRRKYQNNCLRRLVRANRC